jgi:hypothetical protein
MFFSYALEDAMVYMKNAWASPASPNVLMTVLAVATVAMLLVRVGVL